MEDEKTAPADEVFPFKFSPAMLCVFVLALILCAAGIALTTWQLLDFLRGDMSSVYDWLKFILFYFVCGALAVLLVAMLICSRYTVTEKYIVRRLGLICEKFEIKKIYSVNHFRGSGKLAVYFDDFKTKYTIIVVKEAWYADFVKALQRRNPRIEFDFTTAEEENAGKKK